MVLKFLPQFFVIICLVCSKHLERFVNDNSDLSVVKHELLNINKSNHGSIFTLNLTSLQWFSSELSDRSVWWHYVLVSVPDNLDESRPILYLIDDGKNKENDVKSKNSIFFTNFSSQCITVIQRQVPNQPIKFTVSYN